MKKSVKEKLIEMIVERNRISENAKYGEFIIQTNEVQFYLVVAIVLRTYKPTKKLIDNLYESTLGKLIFYFCILAKNPTDLVLIDALNRYKASRDALAHKMFSSKKLTTKECEISIDLGKELLMKLK